MSKVKESNKQREIQLAEEFRKISMKLATYLKQSPYKKEVTIKIQDENSPSAIPDYGPFFGVVYEEGKMILANWLFKLPKREEETIVYLLLVREGFRLYLNQRIQQPVPYSKFCEIMLNIIAAVWIIQEEQYDFVVSPQMNYIRARTAFDDTKHFQQDEWDVFLLTCHRYEIGARQLFEQLIERINLAIQNNQTIDELLENYRAWFRNQIEKREIIALPLYVEKRDFEIIKSLLSLGVENSSAKNIGKRLNCSHDIINTAFKELYEKYNVYWYAMVNYLMLNLYPYFFRLTLKDKKTKKYLFRKFKSIPYIEELYEGRSDKGQIFSALFSCPHILHNNLAAYFEKLSGKGLIKDYFFQRLRRKKLVANLSLNKLQPTTDTYQQLLNDSREFDYHTLVLLDKEFEITRPHKTKKAFFDEDILHFLSILCARHLPKGYYMCFPLTELYDLCKKNDIDTKDSRSLNYFVNQLEIRCRRHGLLDYILNIQKVAYASSIVYFELFIDPGDKTGFIEKILRAPSTSVYLEFYDRIIIGFPMMSLEHPFQEILKNELEEEGINYFTYNNKINLELDRFISYQKLYDYEKNQWKF